MLPARAGEVEPRPGPSAKREWWIENRERREVLRFKGSIQKWRNELDRQADNRRQACPAIFKKVPKFQKNF
jgi:hypothetical protein